MTAIRFNSPPSERGRDRYFDSLRAIAIVRIVAYHAFGYGWLTFLFPSMGVMFAIAGSLIARSLDRLTAEQVIRKRIWRMLPSFWVLGAVVVPAMLWHGWSLPENEGWSAPFYGFVFWIIPLLDPPGTEWAYDATNTLWYIRTYLWLVLLSPLLYFSYRRWPLATVLAPLALASANAFAVVDLHTYGDLGYGLVDLSTYGACWVLGFAHRTGGIRRIPVARLIGLSLLAILAGSAWALTHPNAEFGYDLNEIPFGQAFISVGAVLLILRPSFTLAFLNHSPWLDRIIAVLNARALTIYLWHNICIDIAAYTLELLELWHPALFVGSICLLTTLAVAVFGWIEDIAAGRPPRLLPNLSSLVRPSRAKTLRPYGPKVSRSG